MSNQKNDSLSLETVAVTSNFRHRDVDWRQPDMMVTHRLHALTRDNFDVFATTDGVPVNLITTSRNVLVENKEYFPSDIVSLRDTPDAEINPALEARKRENRRREMAAELGRGRRRRGRGSPTPTHFKLSTDDADVAIRYEFLHVSVAKVTQRERPRGRGPWGIFGRPMETLFHVLLVSNSSRAWRRSAVCVRPWDDFFWLSEHFRQLLHTPCVGRWPAIERVGAGSTDEDKSAKIVRFLRRLVQVPMAQSQRVLPLFLYTDKAVAEIEGFIDGAGGGTAEEPVISGTLQDYEKEVLPEPLTEREVNEYSALCREEGGEYGVDAVAALDGGDATVFEDLDVREERPADNVSATAASAAGEDVADHGEECEGEKPKPTSMPTSQPIHGARPKTRLQPQPQPVARSCSSAFVNSLGKTVVPEEEMHQDKVLESFLRIGSVESVHTDRRGRITVLSESLENLAQCPAGENCSAAIALKKQKEEAEEEARRKRAFGKRRNSLEDMANYGGRSIGGARSRQSGLPVAASLPVGIQNLSTAGFGSSSSGYFSSRRGSGGNGGGSSNVSAASTARTMASESSNKSLPPITEEQMGTEYKN